MSRNFCILLTLASMAASTTLVACEGDESAAKHPRTSNPFATDQGSLDNAARRSTEAPPRPDPATGGETPGRESSSAAVVDPEVLTLQGSGGGGAGGMEGGGTGGGAAANGNPTWSMGPINGFSGPTGWDAFGHTVGPTTTYTNDVYHGYLPHLPPNPGTTPLQGATPAPQGDWLIEHSWGQGLTLENAPHRAWPETAVDYQSVVVKHNPTYTFNIQEQLSMSQTTGTYNSDMTATALQVPWFFINTVLLPVWMVLEPPLAQRIMERASVDPNFGGHLPDQGTTVPVPMPGTLHWEYKFLKSDGTVRDSIEMDLDAMKSQTTDGDVGGKGNPSTTTQATAPAGK